MSRAGDAFARQSTHQDLNHRTATEIQRKIVKRSEQNVATRLLHANGDRETIGKWRVDLNEILHVFNVRSIPSVWPLLIVCLQTEFTMDTDVAVSDTHPPRRPARPVTSPSGPFNTHPNNRTGVSDEHKRKQDRTVVVASMKGANMLKKWGTKLLGSEVKETTAHQIKNVSSALSEPPSESKRAFQ